MSSRQVSPARPWAPSTPTHPVLVGLAALALLGGLSTPTRAQVEGHPHHHPQHASPTPSPPSDHSTHGQEIGPGGATYDLRWLDAMVQHHTGALRMSEFVFAIGEPGVGALARGIWKDQAQEIRAMGQWRKAWYPEAPVYPVALQPGGDPNTMAGLRRMDPEQMAAMRMTGSSPTKDTRVSWFLEGMIAHHGGALVMAHDALAKSTNPTIRRLAREIIVAQRREIIALRRMLAHDGMRKPEYNRFDSLFSF